MLQEIPDQIQDNLAALQLGSSKAGSSNSTTVEPPSLRPRQHRYHQDEGAEDIAERAFFPRLQNRTPNVPLSDEERETMLDNARIPVLRATDAEVQLTWAQDALSYVDVATEYANHIVQCGQPRRQPPVIEHQLLIDAMNIVNFLADQEHPRAEFLKGMWYEFGKFGMRPDRNEAFACYKRAASRGYARAEYRSGMLYETAGQPMLALQHFVAGESQGDSASCYRMGMMAILGQFGQTQDLNRGLHLIRYAADTADENAPQGAFVYGMLLARDLPQIHVPEVLLPLDMDKARMYIEKSAYLGFSKAQLKMASAFELCTLGVDFDPALSLHYNVLAARQGEPEAELSISKWFLCGCDGVFQKNEKIAFEYAERAAASGLTMAEFAMGYYNEIGMLVPVDIGKALEWYGKAAAKGNKDAVSRIEGISVSRTLSINDHERLAVSKIKSRYGSMRGVRPLRHSTVSQMPEIPQGRSMIDSLSDPQRPGPATPHPAGGWHAPTTPSVIGMKQRLGTPNTFNSSSTRPNDRASTPAYYMRTTQIAYGDSNGRDLPPRYGSPLGIKAGNLTAKGLPQRQHAASADQSPVPADSTAAANVYPSEAQANVLNIGFVAPPDPRLSEAYVKPPLQSGDFAGRRLQKLGATADSGRTATASKTLDGKTEDVTKGARLATPVKKGPQTFQEMGFTNIKQESECVSQSGSRWPVCVAVLTRPVDGYVVV